MGLISFLEHHMLRCPSKALLHMDCPGCGMQRSFIFLLKGELLQSLEMHPATIPMLALVSFVPLHLRFKYRNGHRIIIFLQGIIALITVAFYIYKISTNKIFN